MHVEINKATKLKNKLSVLSDNLFLSHYIKPILIILPQ